MEDVLVGIRQAALDAQIAVGIGTFALQGDGMLVVLLHGDAAVEQVGRVFRGRNGVKLDVDVAEQPEVTQGLIGVGDAPQVVGQPLDDLDGVLEGLRLHLRLVVVIEVPSVGSFPHARLYGKFGRIGGLVVHPEDVEVRVDADVANVVFLVGQLVLFQPHGDGKRVIHEVAVDLEVNVVGAEKIVARVFHSLGDDLAYIVESVGVVDVPFLKLEFGTVAHDVAPDEGVVNDVCNLVVGIGLTGIDVPGDSGPFPSGSLRVRHCGMEIAHIIEITHHLGGRFVGLCLVVISGFATEFLIGPFPKLAFGLTFPFVINPIGDSGLEGLFEGLEGDVVRQVRLADVGFLVFDDDFVTLDQALVVGDETVDAARGHEDGHEQPDDDIKPLA